jgi:hypothetical protein
MLRSLLVSPYFEEEKKQRGRRSSVEIEYPILYPYGIPKEYRPFCCFIGAKTDTGTWMGSGTLVETKGLVGILTAYHLIEHTKEEIQVAFYLKNGDWTQFSIPRHYVVVEEPKLDIAFIVAPYLPNDFHPVEIGWDKRNILSLPLTAFGCPNGVFGHVWKPKLITIAGGIIYTKGMAVPGVSGGGIFSRIGNKFYVWGVHTAIHLSSYTLLSRTAKFEIRDE